MSKKEKKNTQWKKINYIVEQLERENEFLV